MKSYEVVVVGAGPAGLTAARRLAELGRRVAVLEEHEQIGDPVNCSGVLGVEAFTRFDLPASLVRHSLQEVEFVSPRGGRWSFEAERPLARVVMRSELDGYLGMKAERAGVEIHLRNRATEIRRQAHGIEVAVSSPGAAGLECRALVLATGAGMPLLKKLRFDQVPGKLLGVQTELAYSADRVEVYLGRQWAPEGFAWIVPLGAGRAKVGLLCDRDGPQTLRRFLARPDVSERMRGPLGPIRCSVLPLGFLPRSYDHRLLVVGEAAGHIKTTTCGGIYYGMLTADIAAEVLHEALSRDRLDAATLSAYESRWRELLEKEIQMGLKLRRSFKLIGDWGIESLMGTARAKGVARLIREKADFDWHRDLIHAVFRDSAVGRILMGGKGGALGADRTLQEYSPV